MSTTFPAAPAVAVDAAAWTEFLTHTRIQVTLAGTGELTQYEAIRAEGARGMLLTDLYPFAWEDQSTRLWYQTRRYETDKLFIDLFQKMVTSLREAPNALSELWTRWEIGYSGRLGDPTHTIEVTYANQSLTRSLEDLYSHTTMRKRHIPIGAANTAETYIKFVARFNAIDKWGELAARFFPQETQFASIDRSMLKFINRLDKVLAYKPESTNG